ncbi:hypothetical protein EGW08_005383 [Elysia chlorotica]|uniref:IMD domain-containing protein n=1 Tax=Elysia chlorotica TaxID=188477 RepID=A0A433TZ35_ELYCH|nr:hypothetical protein EGW08_005383 [Elysia chlorotica]
MESNPEKDSGVLGSLFQTVINEMRGSTPIWEDFTYKSMKLHSSLKTTVVSIGAFLEAFQKVADMATSSKGATREIGSALTRLCMRHRSIESQLKLLTSSIVENLVSPLQDKLEDWKKSVAQLDKDHAKEYKKAKQEIKKAASDTIRLQKKVKKGGSSHGKTEMQYKLDASMLEVNSKYHQLEEAEKNSLRSALIEERSRFCLFITCLKPFVDSELKLLTEMSHIQEIMHSLCLQASDPASLPESSEQVITDLKGVDGASFNFSQQHHHSPPSSPSSLGSRKSSMCSINSINSSSSGSSKSHSPSHTMHKRTASQTSASTVDREAEGDCDSTPTTPSDSTPSASSTWNNWPNLPAAMSRPLDPARPHTISSAYEKGHNRPALKPDLFEPPSEDVEMRPKTSRSQSQSQHRPSATISKLQPVLPPHCPKPTVKAVAPPMVPPTSQPIYANMEELGGGAGQSDTSPDDGEPTTPTTPACNSLAQPRPDGMDVLHAAMQQMNLATASLGIVDTSGSADADQEDISSSQEVTPRSSMDEPASLIALGIGPDPLEVGKALARPKMQQDTSLELAKAIRELEASTAALTSAYDTPPQEPSYAPAPTQAPLISGPPPPPSAQFQTAPPPSATSAGSRNSNGGVAFDTESYTSKTSLQCSSGYGTMNSTPAGSEDTIATGGISSTIPEVPENEMEYCIHGEDCSMLEQTESEKYYTIPRSGEASAAYRAAFQTRRPASTAGIPMSSGALIPGGAGIARRSSVNTGGQKPPPPVRRTSSVTGSAPAHVQKLRNSPPRQVSVDTAMTHQQQQQQYYQGSAQMEPLYAELNQGSNDMEELDNNKYSHSHPSQVDGDGNSHTSTVNVIQSLNAKFASLNNQYREGNGFEPTAGGVPLMERPSLPIQTHSSSSDAEAQQIGHTTATFCCGSSKTATAARKLRWSAATPASGAQAPPCARSAPQTGAPEPKSAPPAPSSLSGQGTRPAKTFSSPSSFSSSISTAPLRIPPTHSGPKCCSCGKQFPPPTTTAPATPSALAEGPGTSHK